MIAKVAVNVSLDVNFTEEMHKGYFDMGLVRKCEMNYYSVSLLFSN